VVAAERVEARGQRPWGVGQREVPGQGSGARLGLTSHWSRHQQRERSGRCWCGSPRALGKDKQKDYNTPIISF
jgi:hypothetical protein